MVAWARERTRASGLSFLGLDTDFNHLKLHSFYEGLGITCAGEKRLTQLDYPL
jgi:hypothetical protein